VAAKLLGSMTDLEPQFLFAQLSDGRQIHPSDQSLVQFGLWHRNRSSAVKLEFETETAAGDLLPARESGLLKLTIVAICLLIVRPG